MQVLVPVLIAAGLATACIGYTFVALAVAPVLVLLALPLAVGAAVLLALIEDTLGL